MKENPKPNTRWYLWLWVVFPILGVILLAGNKIRDMVVLLEYYLWQAVQSIKNVPQATFWAIFCGVYLVFMLHSLMSGNKQTVPSEEQTANNRVERVAFWSNQIRRMQRGNVSRMQFAKSFSKLILDILTYNGEVDRTTYEKELRAGKLDLPNELLLYLKTQSRQLDELQSPKHMSRIKLGVTRLFSSEKPNLPQENNIPRNSLIEPNLLFSVNYLEKELEVDSHQNENR